MKVSYLFLFAFILLLSCSKYDIAKGTPGCIKSKIKSFDKDIDCDNGMAVSKYKFQGEDVFVFDPGTCGADMTSEVVNNNCETQGYLGGISGNSTIKGESFSNAVFVDYVWVKE